MTQVVAGLAALGLVLAACSSSAGSSSTSSASGSASAPYRLLAILPMTGELQASGIAVDRGIKAAVANINAGGGVNGHKFDLTTSDDQSDPTMAASVLQAALTGGSMPNVVIPGISSNEALAMAPLLTRYQTAGIGSASSQQSDNPAKYPYFFAQPALAKDVINAVSTFIASHAGVKRAVLITSNDALGQADEGPFRQVMAAKGISASVQLFPPSATDYTSTFQRAVAGAPDWIFMDGAGAEVPIMLTSRVKANAGTIPTVIGNVASSQPLLSFAKGTNELNNTYSALGPLDAYISPAKRGPEFTAMLKLVGAQGPLVAPLFVYATGWDIVYLLVDGLKNVTGSLTASSLKTSLEHLPPSTDPQFPMFRHTFTPASHNPAAQVSDFTFGQEVGTSDGMIVVKK